jgi:5-carboxymethyl-2-hydroxymuconate isomerase
VRINTFQFYKIANNKKDFIHVFGNIMEGRTTEQKASLSKKVIEKLNEMFPGISILSMNVSEFELATYSNKSLINPLNTERDRFF